MFKKQQPQPQQPIRPHFGSIHNAYVFPFDKDIYYPVGIIPYGPGERTPNEAHGPFTAEAIFEMLKDVKAFAYEGHNFTIFNISEDSAILVCDRNDFMFRQHEIVLDGRTVVTNRAGNFYRYINQIMKFYLLKQLEKLGNLVDVEKSLRTTNVYATINIDGEKLELRQICSSEREAMTAIDVGLGNAWIPVESGGKRFFVTYNM